MTTQLIHYVFILTTLYSVSCQVVGGYRKVTCDDPKVKKAVKYAVDLYFSTSPPPAPRARALNKGEGKKHGKGKGKKSGKSGSEITFKVYSAEKQVVAGVNYKIAATAYVNGICHGAREDVIIFQSLSGEYSVSDWGTRYNCSIVDDSVCLSV